ncbi:MAG: hypothetical protein AAF667_13600 [Pseudomonadota bacterium]
MDTTTLLFYAAICGLLSVFAPRLGGWTNRFGIGVVIGLLSATSLPALRSMVGL